MEVRSIKCALLALNFGLMSCGYLEKGLASKGGFTYRNNNENVVPIQGSSSNDASLIVPGDLTGLANIIISEGSVIADNAVFSLLRIKDNAILSTGPSTNVASSDALNIRPENIVRLQLKIPINSLGSTTSAPVGTMVIFYHVRDLTQKFSMGIIPATQFTVEENYVKFALKGFGNYQVAMLKNSLPLLVSPILVMSPPTSAMKKSSASAINAWEYVTVSYSESSASTDYIQTLSVYAKRKYVTLDGPKECRLLLGKYPGTTSDYVENLTLPADADLLQEFTFQVTRTNPARDGLLQAMLDCTAKSGAIFQSKWVPVPMFTLGSATPMGISNQSNYPVSGVCPLDSTQAIDINIYVIDSTTQERTLFCYVDAIPCVSGAFTSTINCSSADQTVMTLVLSAERSDGSQAEIYTYRDIILH